jgi:hypothetical protein
MPEMTETDSEPHGAPDHHSPAADYGVDHGHDEEPLGPPDVGLWAAGIGGVAVAIVIAACFAFSTGAL